MLPARRRGRRIEAGEYITGPRRAAETGGGERALFRMTCFLFIFEHRVNAISTAHATRSKGAMTDHGQWLSESRTRDFHARQTESE